MTPKIAVIGIGYIGLPLALNLGKYYSTIAYDIDKRLIFRLSKNIDINNEVLEIDFKKSKNISFTSNILDLKTCNYYIITVPTPVDKKNDPDLTILIKVIKKISSYLKLDDTIILESTIYPGATDEVVIPLIEKISKLKLNKDFHVCYSPERANPGDKVHNITNIPKIISASSNKGLKNIEKIYQKIIKANLVKVSNIRTAEAAKIIENTQRDVNIALINEFSMFCKKMKININEVLTASKTKWNFLNFKPGLVGGHCIGVDPYYLNFKANMINLNLDTINSSRNVNESMPKYIFNNIKKISKIKKINIKNANSLIIGAAFKENCPDIRNSGSIKLANYLKNIGSKVSIYDPLVNKQSNEYINEQKFINNIKNNHYEIIIYSVDHKIFKKITFSKIKKYLKKNSIFFDLKFKFKENEVDSFI